MAVCDKYPALLAWYVAAVKSYFTSDDGMYVYHDGRMLSKYASFLSTFADPVYNAILDIAPVKTSALLYVPVAGHLVPFIEM
jgi:hypothetical protein